MQVQGIQNKVTLPEGLAALAGSEIVRFCEFPSSWGKALWGRMPFKEQANDWLADLAPAEVEAALKAVEHMGRAVQDMEVERLASKAVLADGKIPVGWHVEGPGNLTRIVLTWAEDLARRVRRDQREVILSLGGKGGHQSIKLRYVDVIGLLKGVPWRGSASVNGETVSKLTMQGLALIGVALSKERPQALIQQASEETVDFADGEVTTSGWPQFFRPLSAYGELSEFAGRNVDQFMGFMTLRFKKHCWLPELEVLAAPADLRAYVVEQELRAGRCAIPHDQLKNVAAGQGTRAIWLVGDQVVSLPGAGSKPEKFLNRNKLITGTGATVLTGQPSALRIVQG